MTTRLDIDLTEDDVEYIRAYIDNAVGGVAARWPGEELGPLVGIVFDEYSGEDIVTIRDDLCLLLIRRLGREIGLRLENNNLGHYLAHRVKLLEGLEFYEDVHDEVLQDSYNVLCAVLRHVGDAVSDI